MYKSRKTLENCQKHVIFRQNVHVWPPGVTTYVDLGCRKSLRLIGNVFKFIPNGGLGQKQKKRFGSGPPPSLDLKSQKKKSSMQKNQNERDFLGGTFNIR